MSESSLFDEVNPAPLDLPLAHPYTRYGLAVATVQKKLRLDELNEENLREAVIQSIETGLNNFRMRTDDNPSFTRLLRFGPILFEELVANDTLVGSSGLAEKGVYLFPTVLTTDLSVKKTFVSATNILSLLQDGQPLAKEGIGFSRSFAPTTAKINNKRSSQSAPKGSLLEVACALVTTLTPLKPAAWPGQNTIIVPDLPIEELRDFVDLFAHMQRFNVDANLMEAQLREAKPVEDKPKRVSKKPAKETAPKSEFRRPRLHSGNYPFAPRDAGVFGAVGLLGAIGRWAHEAQEIDWAKRVLDAIAGQPLYLVSYDKVSQVRFGHHVVSLSLNGGLAVMIDALWRETKLYADLDSAMIRRDTPAYQLFYLQTSRFLQSFSAPAFNDFLASRAEYPPEMGPLFEEYFKNMDKEIVQSAGVLGQWLNRTAYFVADGEVEAGIGDRMSRVRKAKAKILVEFESAAMSAKSPPDLLFRLSTRCGRLLQDDAPADAKRFMDAVASEEITQLEATHLLIAYMRLRAPRPQTGEPEIVPATPPDPTTTPDDNRVSMPTDD